MIVLGCNNYYIKELLGMLREHALNIYLHQEEHSNIRIYVLSGMSLFQIHQMLASYPPPHASIFVLSERHTYTINELFPKLIKTFVPENTQPDILIRNIIRAARIIKHSPERCYYIQQWSFLPIQQTIILSIVNGSSTSEISATLKISGKSVLAHRRNIFKKMGVRNLQEFYYRWYSLKGRKMNRDIIKTVHTVSGHMSEKVNE